MRAEKGKSVAIYVNVLTPDLLLGLSSAAQQTTHSLTQTDGIVRSKLTKGFSGTKLKEVMI